MEKLIKFRVAIAGFTRIKYVRGSRRSARMYITALSWEKDRITKFRYDLDETKAFKFSKTMAETVQFHFNKYGYHSELIPVKTDGSINPYKNAV